MNIFTQVINNKCIYIPFMLWFIIQDYKVIADLIVNKKLNIKRILGAGGMPSSHSAVVCSLSMLIGREYGFDSGIFAVSIVMAFIVMYDAAGVRRAAGKQARILNKILETPGMTTVEVQGKLIEALGHTPVQVFVGGALGILVGLVI